ncbi:LysE family translocator [Geobacter sp. FeAm09]|uniref:LysE family translocator n=1 Tax=Geobacter sp. FeAm09 TaxID=2597769 RepID=UPI0011EE62E5|nr:LysE family translocator [Geobacter sp. FeAm09]QEM67493.1 LysE family translocator [Geobacter sp. FeAm09]
MSHYLLEFGALAVAHFLALISPGPDFFLIVGTSARQGPGRGAAVCCGIAAANGLYILLALTGCAMVRDHPLLRDGMKTAGALYLLVLAVMLLRAPRHTAGGAAAAPERVPAGSRLRTFGAGFLSAALNPKNAVFYLSLFALIVPPTTPALVQALYGIWMFCAVLCWDLFIVWTIGNGRVTRYVNGSARLLEKGSGIVLFILGIVMLIR